MIQSRIAGGAAATFALLGLGACASTPAYGVREERAVPEPAQAAVVPPPPVGVAMQPIPNPGDGDPRPRARPTSPVAQSTLPPISGALTAAPSTPTPAAASTRRPATYRVQRGDTLFSISRQFGLNPQSLADANGMTFQSILRNGQTLRIPGAAPDLDAAPRVLAQASTPTAAAPAASPPPSTPRPAPGQIVPTAPAPTSTDVATIGRGLFQWPLTGEVLERFGPRGTGQRNDGVNIAAAAGAPVRASAAGEVAYTGDSVPGFGNLVLIRHPGGWVTAYGHLQAASVRMRQAVTQGEQIGAVGQTGTVSQPQLHFEIRYAPTSRDRARPVDPLLLLPPAAG